MGHVCTYICHIWKYYPLAMWQGPLYIYLIYITENYSLHIPNIAQMEKILYELVHPTLLHMYGKWEKNVNLLHLLLSNMCQKQIYPPNSAYMPNIWNAYMGDRCAYMYHIWSMCIKSSAQYNVGTHTYTYRWQMVMDTGLIWFLQISKTYTFLRKLKALRRKWCILAKVTLTPRLCAKQIIWGSISPNTHIVVSFVQSYCLHLVIPPPLNAKIYKGLMYESR